MWILSFNPLNAPVRWAQWLSPYLADERIDPMGHFLGPRGFERQRWAPTWVRWPQGTCYYPRQ